ncbi:MAG: putative Na+/H+ antiporter [Burkholderiales bacterium]|nr:hypothetical protein [Burkholderiales bacterium]MDE1928089.1 putative Na+/H+ antiporter [Burkholderiales bacterium]MDE2504147.1 putative Na+/H+ antiporter [Burkholderiales bacterium]
MTPSTIQLTGTALFALAIAHTFSTPWFERQAQRRPRHAGLWHLLGEVEVVFGFWAMVLVVAIFGIEGSARATGYLESLNFTEPMFVFAIMVIAGTRPVLESASRILQALARALPLRGSLGLYLSVLVFGPLLGSFITEPAAMTLSAMILARHCLGRQVSTRLQYATLGVLFVNVSIGGTLTPFAAPPVLMVAGTWGWDSAHMLTHFGWKAAVAVLVNALGAALLFRRELAQLALLADSTAAPTPLALKAIHIAFLVGVVAFSHHPTMFMGLFLFFLGITQAYPHHQDRLILREGLLVAFFLAGLVVLGGQQAWWLQPLLMGMSSQAVFVGAAALTAVTDNAALTYLGSLVDGLSDPFKYALVAGAVTGGGLTIIANAPNPAGVAILRPHFPAQAVNPLGLFAAALAPTLVAAAAFLWL